VNTVSAAVLPHHPRYYT